MLWRNIMTEPICVKCGSHEFTVAPANMEEHGRAFLFVLCSSCGGVVGVLENFDAGLMLSEIQGTLSIIQSQI